MAVAKIDPKVIFASEAPAQDTPAVFTNKTVGWGESRKNGGRPTIKQSNALQQETDLKILWLNENSVTPFDAAIDYPENAVTIKDGVFKILSLGVWELFLDKSSVGLSNVDNTSDLNKPVSTATQTALNLKADKSTTYTKVEVNNALDLLKPPYLSSDVVDGNQTQDQINLYGGKKYDMPVGGYPLNTCVLLNNGDIAKSTIDGNTNDPNVNMMGWIKTNSASQIFDESGLSQQEINSNFVTPEMYGAKANDPVFDNTTALNTAFATGKDVYSTPDKTYYVTGSIEAKGQKLIGGWKIHSNRQAEWTVTANSDKPSMDKMRVMYMDAQYDLVDLLAIKSLGINTILHYCQFEPTSIRGTDTLRKLLDNMTTVGLDCFVGTVSWVALPNLNDWIALAESYSCVTGYYTWDEPIGNNVSIATQGDLVKAVRALSKKPIAMTDGQIYIGSAERLYSDYDIVFIDAYASKTAESAPTALEFALRGARNSIGFYQSKFPKAKIIPCTQAYIHEYSDGSQIPMENVVEYSDIFGRCRNGDVSFFLWDGFIATDIVDRVKTSSQLQKLVKDICLNDQKGVYFTESKLFGYLDTNAIIRAQDGLSDLQNSLINPVGASVGVTSNITVGVINGNSTIPEASTSDRDFYSLDTFKWGGLLFKGATARAFMNFQVNNFSYTITVAGFSDTRVSTINFSETSDGGYSSKLLATSNYTGGYIQGSGNGKGSGGSLVIDINTTANPSEDKFRDAINGLIVNTNW